MTLVKKVFILFGVSLVVLIAVGIFAGSRWVAQQGPEFAQNVDSAITLGEALAATTDNEGCVTAAIARQNENGGVMQTVKTGLFLRSCLEKSTPTPGFCESVPKRTDFRGTNTWGEAKCPGNTMKSLTCRSLLGQVQEHCQAKRQTT